MTSTQLPMDSALVSSKIRRSVKKNSSNSVKSLVDSNYSGSAITAGRKRKLKKTRRALKKKKQLIEDTDSVSSSDTETEVTAKVQPKKKKRRSKKRVTEPTAESLATLGRAYGNTVSKQNVSKVPQRTQTINKLSHSVSSKTAESREYGDFFSCQTGLSYLETHRIDMINSKGIKRFTDDYLKKLRKCQEFERGHNVQPFASVRLELLGEGSRGKVSPNDVVDGNLIATNVQNVDGDHKNAEKNVVAVTNIEPKNLSAAAVKTIEIIKKFQSGSSIEADLQVPKKKEPEVANAKINSRQKEKENETALAKEKENSDKTNGRKDNNSSKTTTVIDAAVNKVDKEADKSLKKFITGPGSVKKIDKRLQPIEEDPSEKSINLSLGSVGRNSAEYLKLSDHKDNPSGESTSSRHGYVLMKKVLMSSENSVTIVDGRNRYDSKNRKVESHYAERLPVADKDKSLKSIETLYRTDGVMYSPQNNNRNPSNVSRRNQ